MDPVIKMLLEPLVAQGLSGVIIIGMGYWIIGLQRRLDQVQERRVDDALKFANAAHSFSSALDRNTETLKGLLEG